MVKFGKVLEGNLRPEWAAQYIDYKALKKVLKVCQRLRAGSLSWTAAVAEVEKLRDRFPTLFRHDLPRTCTFWALPGEMGALPGSWTICSSTCRAVNRTSP